MRAKKTILILLCLLLIIVLALAAGYIVLQRRDMLDLFTWETEEMPTEVTALAQECVTQLKNDAYSSAYAESDDAQTVLELLRSSFNCTARTERIDRTHAQTTVTTTELDTDALRAQLIENINAIAREYVANAPLTEDIYTPELEYREELVRSLFSRALAECSGTAMQGESFVLPIERTDGQWSFTGKASPVETDAEALCESLYADCAENLEYVRRHYEIAADAVQGFTPDQSCYGTTTDPDVVEAMLNTAYARQLIGDQELTWNRDIQLISGTEYHYYLDESILTLTWKEDVEGAVGTFSEIFLSDASQMRRKLADDTVGSRNFRHATVFAEQANAVLAVGGDFYLHSKINGIVVYQSQLYNYRIDKCDTCYYDANGDLTLVTVAEAGTEEEVRQYIKDNNVLFSLCWGPAIIRDGEDITPSYYACGEINDNYARSAIGQLGHLHYLTMNINCEKPHHYRLVKLKTATEAMLAKGCYTAYTLDGGQTCCTIVNGELINTVQFEAERSVGDIIYFATAVPDR